MARKLTDKTDRRMIGVDLVTDGLLEAIAKYDGSS